MANRRSGGMGGGPRGNRSFSFQGSGVSPWQGSNSMNQGLLSNPQQLAMALTSLLQPQQNNPPSLLSLNTSPGFSNQNRSFDRFGNRGRDMRRHTPYNQNRGGGWRRKSPGRDQRNRKGDNKKNDDKKDSVEVKKEEGKGEDKKGPYQDVPVKFLNCFVCSKELWDGESMYKHIHGRAHRQMLNTLEESMHLIVNILREHMRLTEEKKVIEWNRQERMKKRSGKFNEPESHCNMCDLKFIGKIIAHRRTEGHQRLKRYLHPYCRPCDKEFPARMDWVEHRLTPEHLIRMSEILADKTGGSDGDKIILDEEEDIDAKETEATDDAEDPVLELSEDLSAFEDHIPCYNPDRIISEESLVSFEGVRCELCDRSFENEELASNHLKTKRHYYAFIDAAKAKYKEELAQKSKEDKIKKEANETQDSQTEENADASNEIENSQEETAMETNEEENVVEEVEEEEEEAPVEVVVEKKPEPEKKVTRPGPASSKQPAKSPVPAPGPKSKKARK